MTSAPGSIAALFKIHCVHFDFEGGQAIELRDPVTDSRLGSFPEWDSTGRNALIAYVRATRPRIQAVFRGTPTSNGVHIIGATGTHSQLIEEHVDLVFNPITGLSTPVQFTFASAMPDAIGRHLLTFNWYTLNASDPSLHRPVGTTSHTVCTTWRALVLNPDQELSSWVYSRLVDWTCQWAAGRNNEKDICDAIVSNLASTGLQYGVHVYEVREMLISGGGMCGGWYLMFQQMAHTQGVFVHCRSFRVDWRVLPNGEEHWCALVIRSGGLNQPSPTDPPVQFRDHDGTFPDPAAALVSRVERRYRFWGNPSPEYKADGHCVNFLVYEGRVFLYDACFGTGPFEIHSALPPDDFSVWGGAQLASFKAQYLDAAVDYMLGSLYNGGYLWRSRLRGTNGVTVRTAQIPEMVNGKPGLTFRWGE
jgi:hypothetical protein